MKVIRPGTIYRLSNFSNGEQEINFTERVNGQYVDGTTTEEVIRMLIDRMWELNKSSYSPENISTIHLLKAALEIQEHRLNRKKKRLNGEKGN